MLINLTFLIEDEGGVETPWDGAGWGKYQLMPVSFKSLHPLNGLSALGYCWNQKCLRVALLWWTGIPKVLSGMK